MYREQSNLKPNPNPNSDPNSDPNSNPNTSQVPGDAAAVHASCLHLCGFCGPLWAGEGGGGGGGEGAGSSTDPSSMDVATAVGGAVGGVDAAALSQYGPTGLDLPAMRRAASQLVGTHDFKSFQSKGGRSTTVRTLHPNPSPSPNPNPNPSPSPNPSPNPNPNPNPRCARCTAATWCTPT